MNPSKGLIGMGTAPHRVHYGKRGVRLANAHYEGCVSNAEKGFLMETIVATTFTAATTCGHVPNVGDAVFTLSRPGTGGMQKDSLCPSCFKSRMAEQAGPDLNEAVRLFGLRSVITESNEVQRRERKALAIMANAFADAGIARRYDGHGIPYFSGVITPHGRAMVEYDFYQETWAVSWEPFSRPQNACLERTAGYASFVEAYATALAEEWSMVRSDEERYDYENATS